MCKCDGSCKSKITDEDISKAVHYVFDRYEVKSQPLVGVSSWLCLGGPPLNVLPKFYDEVYARVKEWIRNSPDFEVIETENPYGVTVEVWRIKGPIVQ